MDAFLAHRSGGPGLNVPPDVEDLLRELAPQVLGALARRYGDFDAAEDAVQEALLAAAAAHWPADGVPDEPRGWLIQTAARRLIDQLAQRARPGAAGRAWPHSGSRTARRGPGPGRHADRAVHVLPPGADARRPRSR